MTHIIMPRHILKVLEPYCFSRWEKLAVPEWRDTVAKILKSEEDHALDSEQKKLMHDCLDAWQNNYDLQYEVAQKL